MFAYRSILREAPRPTAVRESRRAPWLAVGVVCFGAFMGQLDASIVTITFPALERDFGVPVAGVQWVSLIYLLGLVALLAPAGRRAAGGLDQRGAAGPVGGLRPEPARLGDRAACGARAGGPGRVHPARGDHPAPADTGLAAPLRAAGPRSGRRRLRVPRPFRAAGPYPAATRPSPG